LEFFCLRRCDALTQICIRYPHFKLPTGFEGNIDLEELFTCLAYLILQSFMNYQLQTESYRAVLRLIMQPDLRVVFRETAQSIQWLGHWEQDNLEGAIPILTVYQMDAGCELINSQGDSGVLICMSRNAQDAYEAWVLGADRFILIDESFNPVVIRDALTFALERIFSILPPHLFDKIVLLPAGGAKNWEVLPSDIIYIQANGESSWCFTTTQGRKAIYARLGACEKILLANGFKRIHKSYLVNPLYISEWRSKIVVLSDGVTLPLTRKKSLYLTD
jgi:LytTr DNA-binding domain